MSALDDFSERLDEVDALLSYVAPETLNEQEHAPASLIESGKKRPFKDATLARSCLILVVSYFEGFMKDLTDESLDWLIVAKVPCNRLSSHIRGRLLETHFRQLQVTKKPAKLWSTLASVAALQEALSSDTAVSDDVLDRESVKRAVTSLEPNRVNELFSALGDADLNRCPTSKYARHLTSLKNIRDNAVHGNESDLPPLSLREVRDRINVLRECAMELSHHADALLAKIIPVEA